MEKKIIVYPVNWYILNLLFPSDWPPPAPTLYSLSELKQQESWLFKNRNTSVRLIWRRHLWLDSLKWKSWVNMKAPTLVVMHSGNKQKRSLLLIESATSTSACVLYANQGCTNPLWSWITGFEMPLKVVVLCCVNLNSIVCFKSNFQVSVVAGAVLNAVSSTVQGCWAMTLTRMTNRRSRTNRPVTSLETTTSRGGETRRFRCNHVIKVKSVTPDVSYLCFFNLRLNFLSPSKQMWQCREAAHNIYHPHSEVAQTLPALSLPAYITVVLWFQWKQSHVSRQPGEGAHAASDCTVRHW